MCHVVTDLVYIKSVPKLEDLSALLCNTYFKAAVTLVRIIRGSLN